MSFASFEYVFFLLAVLSLYYLVARRWQNLLLLAASYFFYGWWDWRFLSLIALSTVVDWGCALAIDGSDDRRRRKVALGVSVATNLGILGFFKYAGFFAGELASLLAGFGLEPPELALRIVLPIGISFYTFQTMAYTIDVYRGRVRAVRDLPTFALFVAFFPQLVAGPIERPERLLPQLEGRRVVDRDRVARACQLLLLGFFKKLVIADGAAPFVDRLFAAPEAALGVDLWCGLYLFALQIYCDFSGYTDIARGTALLFGIDLSINFRQPYLSSNIRDFWRRWHISLSTWLRDYLYIPLGGNRRGPARTQMNLMTTMLLGGLWHGASWNFVLWGGLHGLLLGAHKALARGGGRRRAGIEPRAGRWLGTIGTFHLVTLAWVLFRAPDLGVAGSYYRGLLGVVGTFPAGSGTLLATTAGLAVLLLCVEVPCWRWERGLAVPGDGSPLLRGVVFAALFLAISLVGESRVPPFIYFQF